MDPKTLLPSRTPSRRRSSRMSAVASTPVTPGRSSAPQSRSSSSERSAIAYGSAPTPLAPRAGWSAAMIIALPCSPRIEVAFTRRAAAAAMAPGSPTRADTIRLSFSDGTGHLVQLGVDFRLGRHGVGAGQPARDDRAGGIGEGHRPTGVPAGQQSVAQRPAEGVAGAQAVDHVHRNRRDLG